MKKNYLSKRLLSLSIVSALLMSSLSVSVWAKTTSIDEIYAAAYKATINALNTKTQKSINEARKAIANMKDAGITWAVGEFSKQVDTVQHPLLVKVIKAIETAQANPTQANINAARLTVDPDFPVAWKNSYSSAIDKVQQELIDKAWTSYKKASETQNKADIEVANQLIDELKTASSANVVTWANAVEQKIDSIVIPNEPTKPTDHDSIPVVAPNEVVTLPLAVPKGYTAYLVPSRYTKLEDLINYPDKVVLVGDGVTKTVKVPEVQGMYALLLTKNGQIESRYEDVVYVSLGVTATYSDYTLQINSKATKSGWLVFTFDDGEGAFARGRFKVDESLSVENIASKVETAFQGGWFTDIYPYRIKASGTIVTVSTNYGTTPTKAVSLTVE